MQVMRVGIVFALAIILSSTGRGQSLIMQLPADGEWATYKMETTRKLPKFGNNSPDIVRNIESRLTLRVIGTQIDTGAKRRRIEIEITTPEGERIEVLSFVVREANVGQDHPTIIEDLDEYVRVYSGAQLTKASITSNLAELERFFGTKLERAEPVDAEVVLINSQKFECQGISGVSKTETDKQTRTTKYTCYTNPTAPFGCMRFSSEMEIGLRTKSGEIGAVGGHTTRLTLENWGTGAESVILSAISNVTKRRTEVRDAVQLAKCLSSRTPLTLAFVPTSGAEQLHQFRSNVTHFFLVSCADFRSHS